MPEISVIIPVKDNAALILPTVRSVLSQSFEDFELIIIDDGSSDNTVELIKTLKDSRIRLFTQKNAGIASTLNIGISHTIGKYISFLDHDDLYHPERLSVMYNLLEEHPEYSGCFSYIDIIDDNGDYVRSLNGTDSHWFASMVNPQNFPLCFLIHSPVYTNSNFFCRKVVLEKYNGYRLFKYCSDYDLFIRVSETEKLYEIKTPLLQYRELFASTSKESHISTVFERAYLYAEYLYKSKLQNNLSDNIGATGLFELYKTLDLFKIEGINTLILTLILYMKEYPESLDPFFEELIVKRTHPFRKNLEAVFEQKLFNRVKKLAEKVNATGNQNVIVYGAGEIGQRFIAIAEEFNISIKYIVDQKQSLWGRKVGNISIKNPESLKQDDHTTIVICSFDFKDEIEKAIHSFKDNHTSFIIKD